MDHKSENKWSAMERSDGYLVSGFSLAVLEQVDIAFINPRNSGMLFL